jgi:catechol 2,3-dioxygenase-like lactoylglutathione lyase family enzyme
MTRSPIAELRFTHFGIYVQDLDAMAGFYQEVLGFVETDRGYLGDRRLVFLSRDPAEHHQIVFVSGLTRTPVEEVINQISFKLGSLEALLDFARMVAARGVDDLRPINHGNAWSVYFRDPEGNRIEVYTPTPWYISQPCREPIDLDRSAEEIRRETEAWCRTQPRFEPAADYEARLAKRMAEASRTFPL